MNLDKLLGKKSTKVTKSPTFDLKGRLKAASTYLQNTNKAWDF
jgi:hypothetical protein